MLVAAAAAKAEDHPFYIGGDISSLTDLEKLGAVYRDNGKAADALTILRNHNCNLFRVRLFVNPSHDFDKTGGATQDLPMVLALCKRIKKAGGKISLAIHYSDTWADPAHQIKPAEWKDLPIDALEQKVGEYTTSVMRAMRSNDTSPEIVEVGNETTNGMLWPDGKLGGKASAETDWNNYVRLEKAGIKAVRSELPDARVLVHINSGGKAKVPGWFFGKLKEHNVDYDIIGLSFYPNWGDSMEGLKVNLKELPSFGKDILVIETAYPSRAMKQTAEMTWPVTPAGQKQFLDELVSTVQQTPDHRGNGVVWWYPEAVPVEHHRIWDGGAQSLFDPQGNLLPSMSGR